MSFQCFVCAPRANVYIALGIEVDVRDVDGDTRLLRAQRMGRFASNIANSFPLRPRVEIEFASSKPSLSLTDSLPSSSSTTIRGRLWHHFTMYLLWKAFALQIVQDFYEVKLLKMQFYLVYFKILRIHCNNYIFNIKLNN